MRNVPNTTHKNAFTLVEITLVVAVLGIVALIGLTTVAKFRPAVQHSKLLSDVSQLNSAVRIYQHSGGNLGGLTDPDLVIAKLKTHRDTATAKSFVGYTGSVVDLRMATIQVDSTFKGPRAVYQPSKKRFEITTSPVDGFRFTLDENAAAPTAESREASVLEFASTGTWVWDYEETTAPDKIEPTLIAMTSVLPPISDPPGAVGDPSGPSTPDLNKLLPPTFSVPTDFYDMENFPLTVALNDPNGAGKGKIIYGLINQQGWEWTEYTGPIQVGPEDKIFAFVESLTPQEYHHSDPADESYNWTAVLGTPIVTFSNDEIEARTGSVTVTIDHGIADSFTWGEIEFSIPESAYEVQYKLLPSVPGEGTATDWATYEGAFDVGGPQFPHGFEVIAKVVSNSPNFSDGAEATGNVSAYYLLDEPIIESTKDALTIEGETATITLVNPNPSDSSDLVYQVLDANGNSSTGWLMYSQPFDVSSNDYPAGLTINAMAMPVDSYFRESEEAARIIAINFFGIEITGNTIFILDSSGSMSTNDRITRLKDAATKALQVFGTDDSFAMIDYDTTPKVIAPWGPGTSSRKQNAVDAIGGMDAAGSTNYHAALQSALDLNAGGVTQVIFLSDGRPWNTTLSNPASTAGILDLIDDLIDSGVTQVDTVGLGSIPAILSAMADRGNGTSVMVADD